MRRNPGCFLFVLIGTIGLLTSSLRAAEETPAPDAQFFEVIKTDDVNGLDLMEDLRHVVFVHQDVNLVSVWDIYTLRKVASFETPAPRCVLCRGTCAYVGSFDGKLTVFDSAKDWQKTAEVKLPLNVLTLSAPGGKAFKGHLLALCEFDQKQRQMVFIDTKTKKAKAISNPGELSGCAVDFDGKAYLWQGAGGSPARAVEGFKSWPLLVAGRDVPAGQRQYDTLPIIRQVQPGPYWFGGYAICKGIPPVPMGKGRSQFVIPDRSKQLAYVFPNRSVLECIELTGTLETVGTQKIFFPKEHGRFIEMNPHVTCFYDFLSFAVTGRDKKLRVFSYDGHQKLVWTVTVDAFDGADARVSQEPPLVAANVPAGDPPQRPTTKTAPKAIPKPPMESAAPVPMNAASGARTWSDATGLFKVEATLVEIIGDKVKLKRTDGKENVVPIAQLSASDQAFLKTARPAEPAPTTKPAPMPSDTPMTLVLPVVATDVQTPAQGLSQDYAKDSAAADAKYKDKMVEISGLVLEPRNRPVGDTVSVHVTWPLAEGEFIICRLHRTANPHSVDLWPGQVVKLAGLSLGNPFKPMLDDCRFTQIGPPPKAENVNAQTLIDDFKADTKAANEKYAGKKLILEGFVKGIDKKDQYVFIAGKVGDDSLVIGASWGQIYKDQVEAVEKMTIGSPITLRAICGEKGSFGKHIPLSFWAVK